MRDHPRSRGVYMPRYASLPQAEGSSPLARGLPLGGTLAGDGEGIIPARAGFTRRSGLLWTSDWDHPRSRGVYSNDTLVIGLREGSSPLARGLPVAAAKTATGDRIIPARAGFTPRLRSSCGATGDHPRSRGVYVVTSGPWPGPSGSSPLARGLRGQVLGDVVPSGIIPARAGFTPPSVFRVGANWDHPRSRGVYRAGPRSYGWGGGSSPLARGLRRRGPEGAPGAQDHPRSRGVYFDEEDLNGALRGSSPLARGLRQDPLDDQVGLGIIPARAGFTRLEPVFDVVVHRIIPARAGFTRSGRLSGSW